MSCSPHATVDHAVLVRTDLFKRRVIPRSVVPPTSPVPAGGGEPGVPLVALIKAVRTADWNTARLHLREEEVPPTTPKASEMKDYFHGLALNYGKPCAVNG